MSSEIFFRFVLQYMGKGVGFMAVSDIFQYLCTHVVGLLWNVQFWLDPGQDG